MLNQIARMLEPDQADVLLDLCCGNGVVTKPIAARVRRVVRVDFSEELIKLAQTHHQASNLSYRKKMSDARPLSEAT
ncbi:MAG: class I SAM-dependent methyltransferase [Pseudomonadota bacterium]